MNVPKLRFKEFSDEWKKAKLSSFVNINPKNNSLPDKFIYIDLESVNNGLLTSRKIVNKSEAPSRAQRTIIKNDILYQTVRPYQMNNLFINSLDSDYPYIASTGYALLRTKENPYFVYSILYQKSFVNKVLDMCTGTSYPAISANDLGTISICLPSIKEQEKIGKTLSLLDKKIELQTKKIEDLKLFKKGLINVLNKKSYQETALGKIGKFQTSSIDKLVKENEKIVNLYNYMDVYKHKILMTQDLSKLSKTSAKDNQITINNLKRGDILFTPSSETPDDIGHSICIQEDLPNTVYSYHLLRYRPNIIMDPLFSNYYFNNSKIRKQIIRYATGATRYTISLDSFLKIKVNIPDLITQKKYGLLLYSTDKKVNKELLKLNKLQELKKGLMQNMFV